MALCQLSFDVGSNLDHHLIGIGATSGETIWLGVLARLEIWLGQAKAAGLFEELHSIPDLARCFAMIVKGRFGTRLGSKVDVLVIFFYI